MDNQEGKTENDDQTVHDIRSASSQGIDVVLGDDTNRATIRDLYEIAAAKKRCVEIQKEIAETKKAHAELQKAHEEIQREYADLNAPIPHRMNRHERRKMKKVRRNNK